MKEIFLRNYDTIIFDLGEVIVDLDPQAVEDRLFAASRKELDYRDLVFTSPLIKQYETGRITEGAFRKEMNELLNISLSDDEFDEVWNLMLSEIPIDRLNFMEQLKSEFQVMILSNTNSIHERKFDEMVGAVTAGRKMADFVHHAHYSHEVGLSKPDQEVYHYVLNRHDLVPERTLFLDDRQDNVAAARMTGIDARQVEFPDQIFDLLQYERG